MCGAPQRRAHAGALSAGRLDDQLYLHRRAERQLGHPDGEAGLHARSAVGVAELPLGAPVEVELIVEAAG